jgi:hypothetical protein
MSLVFNDLRLGDTGYLAPSSCYWALPEKDRACFVNGCGPQSAKLDLVPDELLGVDLGPACDIHDVCYHFGSDEADKRLADLVFLFNLLFSVNLHCCEEGIVDRMKRVFLRSMAFNYYRAVSDWGSHAFWDGKDRQ